MNFNNNSLKMHKNKSLLDKANELIGGGRIVHSGSKSIGMFKYKGAHGHESGLLLGDIQNIKSCFKALTDSKGNEPKEVHNLKFSDGSLFTGYLFESTKKNFDVLNNALDSFLEGNDYPCGSKIIFQVYDGKIKIEEENEFNTVSFCDGDACLVDVVKNYLISRDDMDDFRLVIDDEITTLKSLDPKYVESTVQLTLLNVLSKIPNDIDLTLSVWWGIGGVCIVDKNKNYIPIYRPKNENKNSTMIENYLHLQRLAQKKNDFSSLSNRSGARSLSPHASDRQPKCSNSLSRFGDQRARSASRRVVTGDTGKVNKRIRINNVLRPVNKEEDLDIQDSCRVERGGVCGVNTVGSPAKPGICGLCGCTGHSQDRCVCPFCKKINAHVPRLCHLIDARYNSAEAIGLKSLDTLEGVDTNSLKNTDARFLINVKTNGLDDFRPIAVGQLEDIKALQASIEDQETIILTNLYDYITNRKPFKSYELDGCISRYFRESLKKVFRNRLLPGSVSGIKQTPRNQIQKKESTTPPSLKKKQYSFNIDDIKSDKTSVKLFDDDEDLIIKKKYDFSEENDFEKYLHVRKATYNPKNGDPAESSESIKEDFESDRRRERDAFEAEKVPTIVQRREKSVAINAEEVSHVNPRNYTSNRPQNKMFERMKNSNSAYDRKSPFASMRS